MSQDHHTCTSLEAAAAKLLAAISPVLSFQSVRLDDALGRVAAQDIYASFDHPPFDRSPLDGYALQSRDVEGVSSEHPATLRVVERVCAGEVPTQRVTPGTAVRIMTGAPIPPGADCVIRQEDLDYLNKIIL